MSKVILLDLDDTLLYYPLGVSFFVERYLEELIASLKDVLPDAKPILVGAVRAILKNTDPTRRNEDHYWDALRGAAENEAHFQGIRAGLEYFYTHVYPDLRTLTEPVPIAAQLIKNLREGGYAVILATNPLYSRQLIEERVRWAGLDPADFNRITHAENSHFSKPHPHYYEEALTHLGYEPYDAIMVGDSWENDIVAAAACGMRTFWVQNPFSKPDDRVTADGQGSLADFYACVFDHQWLEHLPPKVLESSHIIPRMIGNVGTLMGMIEAMPDRFWHQHPDPKEWSPIEIVLHLAESEAEYQRPRLQTIAREINPFLRSSKTPFQPFDRNLSDLNGRAVALQFASERQMTVEFLQTLSPEDWARPARHSIYGPSSMLEMAAFTTRHDQLHIKQFCQTIGKCE